MKFSESGECVDKITPESKGKEILVPLTSCMYVPGQISDAEKLLIDIGTGYYVEKDIAGTKDYFTRKVKFVTEQMEKIQKIATEKSKLREVVMDIMEVQLDKQLAVIAQQQQAAGAKAWFFFTALTGCSQYNKVIEVKIEEGHILSITKNCPSPHKKI